ncbi:DUF5518 domain-containing protein [Halorussus sp. MSC15.2]|uniref:DUF5518 domain-containing protein n=1 Tax=Halorussus sp. MSC15.2 TaxID=2283638 RepID=UPI0013D05690|nr:DUF5518 domain-containing protein [Halorussus sp. MSC15.2]NEU55212.1 hypothetical protein [Halorussus sp. MSC15.2]
MEEERTTVRSTNYSPGDEKRPRNDDPNTLLNALVGAVVTVVGAPVLPFSAVVGGGVAGYLQRGDLGEGATVGAVAGALAAIPAFLFAWVVVGVFLLGADPFFALSGLFAGFLFVVVVGYLVGAGALGGALGAYLRREL